MSTLNRNFHFYSFHCSGRSLCASNRRKERRSCQGLGVRTRKQELGADNPKTNFVFKSCHPSHCSIIFDGCSFPDNFVPSQGICLMDSSSIFHESAHILLQCTNKDKTSAVTQRRASFIDGYWPFSIFIPYHVPSSLLPFFVTHSPCQHPGTLQTLAASLWLFFLIFSGVLPWRVIFRLLLLLSLMMQLRIVACTSLNEPLMKSE